MQGNIQNSRIGRHILDRDWSDTELGPFEAWPISLRTTLVTMLACPTAMFLAWGPKLRSFYNDAYEPILGYRADSALGTPFRELWSSIWDEISPLVDEALAGRKTKVVDMRLDLSRSGEPEESYWTFTYSPAFDDEGRVAGMLCVTAETTDRVIAERERAVSDERLELALAAGAIIGTWVWDVVADRFTVDEAFANAFGLDPALGRVGLSLAQVVETVHPDDQEGLAAAITEAIERGGAYAHQYRVRRADGRYYWIEANGRVEKAADGTPLTFPGVLLDVEERRAVEAERDRVAAALRALNDTLEQRVRERTEELEQAQERLRQSQKMEAIGQLTGGLAHDFNNLLAGISGSLEMMAIRIGQGRMGDVEKYNSAAQGATKRAAALTHRLLAFSRRQTLDPKPTLPNRLVEDMIDLIHRTVGPAIDIRFAPAEDIWATFVDPHQLENALLNLSINARDAMPDGGRITIETSNRTVDERSALLRGMEPGNYVTLCVTDTGTGMTSDVIAKAFDPFFTTKPIGVGTGLGLSMVYGFVKQSGGQVRIHSEPGHGTSVCIYLPRHLGDAETNDQTPDLTEAPRADRGETVLVVDDEPAVRMLVTDVLEELGYAAIEAGDGAGGLRILQSETRVDLLISDVGLPGGMNGRQMADAARVYRPDLKVLFITGYAENAAIGNGLLAPGMHVMTKPFAMEALATRIRGLLERRQSEIAS